MNIYIYTLGYSTDNGNGRDCLTHYFGSGHSFPANKKNEKNEKNEKGKEGKEEGEEDRGNIGGAGVGVGVQQDLWAKLGS